MYFQGASVIAQPPLGAPARRVDSVRVLGRAVEVETHRRPSSVSAHGENLTSLRRLASVAPGRRCRPERSLCMSGMRRA